MRFGARWSKAAQHFVGVFRKDGKALGQQRSVIPFCTFKEEMVKHQVVHSFSEYYMSYRLSRPLKRLAAHAPKAPVSVGNAGKTLMRDATVEK